LPADKSENKDRNIILKTFLITDFVQYDWGVMK